VVGALDPFHRLDMAGRRAIEVRELVAGEWSFTLTVTRVGRGGDKSFV
jgi:hypothetical protein